MVERERKRVPINLPLCLQKGKSDQWESRMRKADLIKPVQQHDYCPPPTSEDVKVNNQDPLRRERGGEGG